MKEKIYQALRLAEEEFRGQSQDALIRIYLRLKGVALEPNFNSKTLETGRRMGRRFDVGCLRNGFNLEEAVLYYTNLHKKKFPKKNYVI